MLQHMMLESGIPLALSSSKMEHVKGAVTIDTDQAPPLEVSLKERLEQTLRWEASEPFALSRIPHIVRETHKDLYEPRVMSIGPYHRGRRSLIDFLDRNPNVRIEVYIAKIGQLEDRARRCYSKNEFVEMLLLDGCFLLEFFFKVRAREPLDVGWGTKTIIGDLLLLENQIPFLSLFSSRSILLSLAMRVTETRCSLLHPSSISPDLEARGKIYHLLHLYYQWFIPAKSQGQDAVAVAALNLQSRPSCIIEQVLKKVLYSFLTMYPYNLVQFNTNPDI